MAEMSEFQKECIRLALAKMFRPDGYFDICAVDQCLRITGAVPEAREYEALRVLHCIHFRDMTATMRQEVAQRTVALFDSPAFDLPQLHKSFLPTPPAREDAQTPTLWQRAKGALTS